MADPYGLELSGLTPELSAEAAALARRQKVAEAMGMQAMQPLPVNRMAGRMAVPISPFEGMAQLLRGYSSGKALEGIDSQRSDIARRGREAVVNEVARIRGIASGTPETTATHVADDQLAYGGAPTDSTSTQVTTPGIAPNPQRAADEAMLSTLPQANRYGQVLQGSIDKRDAQKAQIEQRQWETTQRAADKLEQIEADAREKRITREEADKRAKELKKETDAALFEHQKEMKRLGIALVTASRQPQAPIAVMGPDGKATYVSPQNAIGKSPASKSGGGMSATAQKELIQTDEEIQGGGQALTLLKQAKDLNDKAMGGFGRGALATAGSILPSAMRPQAVDDTLELDNIITNSALPQLKSIFGGMPTEGERKVLLEVQGSSSKPAEVRTGIFDRAQKAVENRLKFAKEKSKSLRSGTYFSGDGGVDPASAAPPADSPAGAPKPGTVQDGYRFKGGNPADKASWEKV